MNKVLRPRNDKNQPHGYWEQYWGNGLLLYRCVYVNGKENGIVEQYWDKDGKITKKSYQL